MDNQKWETVGACLVYTGVAVVLVFLLLEWMAAAAALIWGAY